MQQGTGLQFYYIIADPKVCEKHISTKKTVNAILFKLQVIHSTLTTEIGFCSAMQ